jgi:parvulin-like peptidyl-prolyl isomerase
MTNNMLQSIAEIKTLINQAESELIQLNAGKKAAAPRVRSSLQKVKNMSHALRGVVMEHVKGMPVNSRTKKTTAAEEELPPPPALKREKTVAITPEADESQTPAKPKRAPRKKAIKEK